jgi:ribosome-associated translation inhibitor RaiA
MKIFKKISQIAFMLIAISGCVSIPSEAPELSAELGQRISAIESSNIILLQRFFDQKRSEVDRFIDEEWVPLFAEKFFNNPQISKMWDKIVKSNNKTDRLDFIIKLGPKLIAKISEKRASMIRPLDELEREIERQIRAEYSQAKAINNSITSFLVSAAEVANNRNRYLNELGVSETDVSSAINKTDDAISSLLSKTETVADKVAAAETYIDKIKKIKNSL